MSRERGEGRLRTWLAAAKPLSWPKLLVPFALGQAIGLAGSDAPSLAGCLFGLLFTLLDLLFIVFLNDWGDRHVDAIKREMFPSSSPKTIPDGRLPARGLLLAGLAAGVAAIGVAALGHGLLGRDWSLPMVLLALGIFVAYSLPPVRLNYRGGGELLEMLGVGLVLPWVNAYFQGGTLCPDAMVLLPGFCVLSLASAVASGLSDERSDRRGGKRTFVTYFGNRIGRRTVEALTFGGAATWALTAAYSNALPWWIPAAAASVACFHGGALVAVSRAATTDAFDAQRRYKAELHRAVWRGGLVASMLLATWHGFLA